MSETGLPPATEAAPATPATPEAPESSEDRLARMEKLVEKIATSVGRETPPTTVPNDEAAEKLRQELEAAAATDAGLRHSLTIGQGLYNHFQKELGAMRAELEIARIEDPEERRLTDEAVKTGEFTTVAAARRAVRGDLAARPKPETPKPTVEEQRQQVEKVKAKDANVRGVTAPDFKKRMDDKEYATKVGDPSVPMEERIKLRRERTASR